MILGHGPARSERTIVAEYQRFLDEDDDLENATIRGRLQDAPRTLSRRIGKPLGQWQDEDLLAVYRELW